MGGGRRSREPLDERVARRLRDAGQRMRAAHRERQGEALGRTARRRAELALERHEVVDGDHARRARRAHEVAVGGQHAVASPRRARRPQRPHGIADRAQVPAEARVARRLLPRPARQQQVLVVAAAAGQRPEQLAHVAAAAGRHLRGGAGVDGEAHAGGLGTASRRLRPVSSRPRVVVLRGHQANPWELRPWELIGERYDVVYLRSRRNWFATGAIGLPAREARTLRDLLPSGRVGDMAVRVPGDRYLGLAEELRGADIVHAQELGYWYAMQAARLRARLGFRLVLTVWETLPFLGVYRNVRTRAYRRETIAQTERFLAATQRAADSLLVEGAEPERVRVCPPGIDLERFSPSGVVPEGPPLVLSPGRLVWEKGHQDLLRALALLRRRGEPGADARVCIVGAGPEEARLRRYAQELGIADAVEL